MLDDAGIWLHACCAIPQYCTECLVPAAPFSPPTLPLTLTLPACQVDELYNHRTRLVCSAAAPPDQLFVGADHSEPIIDLEQLQVRVWLVLEPG